MTIGERIKSRRIELGLTCDDIAEQVGKSRATIYRYESDEIENMPLDIIIPLSKALRTSVSFLMGWDVNTSAPTAMIPIYGKIPAGLPALAEQTVEGWLPTDKPNPDEYFYLRVSGSSMIGAGITDGCRVLIHKQHTADDGQIVACRVNGTEATLKRFKRQGDVVLLLPENSEFEPQIVPISAFLSGEAEIIGVAKQILTDL